MDMPTPRLEIQHDARWKVSYGELSLGTYPTEPDAQVVYIGLLAAIGIATQPLRDAIDELLVENADLKTQLAAINSAVTAGKHSDTKVAANS